jgi:hypothetical protein
MALGAGNIPLGMSGLFISGVLCVNLLTFSGRADAKGAAVFNFLTAVLATAVAFHNWLVGGSPLYAAQGFLFAFTYWWLGFNLYKGVEDQRAFGWYCLFVSLNVIPFAIYTFKAEAWILGWNWLLWGVAWFMFFVLLALRKDQYFKLMMVISWVTTAVLWFCSLGWLLGWMDFQKFYGFW